MQREAMTTWLDAFGLLLVAAGVAALLLPWIGWSCLAVAGLVVLGGSIVSARVARGPAERPASR